MNHAVRTIIGVTVFILAAYGILSVEKNENELIRREPETKIDMSLPAKIDARYETETLDTKVREEARRFGKDENTYRMLVRLDPDDSKVYRQIGMFVIADPSGEEQIFPDEI